MTLQPNQQLFDVLKGFATISLEELNATMSLMERIEKKYLIALEDLGSIMHKLRNDYFVLSINNNSIFTYDNIYMDTDDYLFYHQHEQGKKSRMKVRSREYVDSKIAFFECKQRDGEVIRKSRYGLPLPESKILTDQSKSFYTNICHSLGLEYADVALKPTLRTLYKRITLCSKKNDERITIDFDVQIQDITKKGSDSASFGPIAIIETKSSHKKSKSHNIIENLGYKEAKGCSKYCMGMVLVGKIAQTKRFKASMNFMNKVNKPAIKIQEKTSQKLSTIKQQVVNGIKQTAPRRTKTTTPATKASSTTKKPIAKTTTKSKKELVAA